MAEIHIHKAKCDGCDKEVNITEASGWFRVSQYVTSEDEYMQRMEMAEQTGNAGIINGDLCSTACLASWANNVHTLDGMES